MAQVHLHLERLELVRQAGAGFGAHLLVCPLLQTVEFLVDVHDCGWAMGRAMAARVGRRGDGEGAGKNYRSVSACTQCQRGAQLSKASRAGKKGVHRQGGREEESDVSQRWAVAAQKNGLRVSVLVFTWASLWWLNGQLADHLPKRGRSVLTRRDHRPEIRGLPPTRRRPPPAPHSRPNLLQSTPNRPQSIPCRPALPSLLVKHHNHSCPVSAPPSTSNRLPTLLMLPLHLPDSWNLRRRLLVVPHLACF